MNKNKQPTAYLPKNIQITLISTVTIAFAVNTVYSIMLLMRIYPHGMRMSQFTLMTFIFMLLPVILFVSSYLVSRKNLSRFDRLFFATALTLAGYFILRFVSVIDRILATHSSIYHSAPFLNGGMIALPVVVTLALYASLLYTLRQPKKNIDNTRSLQRIMIPLAILAFIVDATFSACSLVMRHIGSKDIMNLLTHPDFITSIVLPIVFFVTAYLVIQKTTRLNRLFIATLYATVGVLITMIILTVSNYSLQTTYIMIVSLTIYVLLIIAHNWTRLLDRKQK